MSKFTKMLTGLFFSAFVLSACGDDNTSGSAPTESPVENPAPEGTAPTEDAPATPAPN